MPYEIERKLNWPSLVYFLLRTSWKLGCLPKRTCEANPAGKVAHSFFTVYVKSVPLYHFKLACVVLHMAVKEFFEKKEKYAVLILRVIFGQPWKSVAVYSWICIQSLRFVSCYNCVYDSWKYVMYRYQAGNIRCNENSACTFHVRWNEEWNLKVS